LATVGSFASEALFGTAHHQALARRALDDRTHSDIDRLQWGLLAGSAATFSQAVRCRVYAFTHYRSYEWPYCDAMLIDNRGDAFVAYLKQIEEHADPVILALVRDTYGEEHLKPYVTM
jgi:hypothetical protein